MAKRKTPKVKKPEKVTNEQLNKIQNSISSMNKAQIQLGGMELEKHRILHVVATIQDKLTILRGELTSQYGTDDINIETGEINYNKNEQTNKKD